MRFFYILILVLLVTQLNGQEEILNYDVNITIRSDNNIEVTETIEVRAEGNQIRKGIFRTIPAIRPDRHGRNEPAPIKVLSVKRDGKKEAYHLEKNRNQVVVYIGKESVILEPGVYTYELSYQAENQIGFFEDYDELYWNAIGHDWTFPIKNYTATIHLPGGAGYVQGSCYTGYAGSTASQCTIDAAKGDQVVHGTGTRSLTPGQGFTIAVAWTKGFVNEGSTRSYRIDWVNILLLGLGLLYFFLFGYRQWEKVGVDPPEVPVVPDWHPPNGYSPAENSYLYHRKITNEALSSALVNAAVQGAIRIENKRKKFTFYRTGPSDHLQLEERTLVDRLLPPGKDSFVMKESNYRSYEYAKGAFKSVLSEKLTIQDYFRPNWKQGFVALLIMALVCTLSLSIGMYPLMANIFLSMLILFLLLGVAFTMISLLFRIMKWYKWIFIIPGWVALTSFIVVVYSQALFFVSGYGWVSGIVALALLLVGIYNYLIYAPTIKGQKVTAQVKGFRMYLDKSEKALLEYFTPPEKTPELFEKMLPFAIALGVENKWAKKFKNVLDQAIEEGKYSPVWYSGNIHQINSLHSNFQSSVSHAAPKSSSGSGGGGFSGGGGGGGGGGGW